MNSPGLTCILTARLDEKSQAFFDEMRFRYFPEKRNLLRAHLTLFHKLPDTEQTQKILAGLDQQTFHSSVNSIKNIGRGVAYFIDCNELSKLHSYLQQQFLSELSAQDQQVIRPHITIQNKVKPEEARALLNILQTGFAPFQITVHGLDLWHYLDGPWAHCRYFPFEPPS